MGTFIPRKKDLPWIPIVIGVPALCAVLIRFILVLLNLYVPEITVTPVEMLVMFVKNFWEESGMIGVGIGFYGFVL